MYIFNQGKYKSLHAQQAGELAAIRQRLLQDHDFRPTYHLTADTGLINDPNGLIFDGEHYHLFCQWFPFGAMHGMKHWQHWITQDFRTFWQGDLLIPDELFESHGCYSGGAILWHGQIVAFYTGNVRRQCDNQRIPHQNIAIFDRSGKLLEKRCLLSEAPVGYTEHVRDPKPFITDEGKIRFVLGAQREDLTGTALLYEMDDLDSPPRLLGELALTGVDNHNVFMWECPDLFRLAGQDLFIWSPQGKARALYQFQNNFHATYALGALSGLAFNTAHCEELDYGFDFYAPQSVQQSNGILLGWVGLPDLQYPTDRFQWHSMLSLPRQLTVVEGKLHQMPLASVYSQLTERQAITLNGCIEIAGLDTAYLQISVENQPLVLHFFANEQGHQLVLRYQNGVLSLDRTDSEQTNIMRQFGSVRHCEVANLQQLAIFIDRSVIEIFVNNGEKVLTARFFIANRQNRLCTSRPICAEIAHVCPICFTEMPISHS